MSLAFLFPGQAAQYVGMGQDLYDASPAARDVFDQACDILQTDLKTVCFNGPAETLKQTATTQPAVFTHSVAALRALEHKNIRPRIVAGHSVGELAALVAAEVLSLEDGLRIVGVRGQAMQEANVEQPGAMAAILGLDDEVVIALCEGIQGRVVAANFNCPGQVVISGEQTAVREAVEAAKEKGARRALELPVGGAFHSPLMQPAVTALSEALEAASFSPARIPVIPNVTAEPTTDPRRLKHLLTQQAVSPVRWTASMQRMAAEGVDRALEVGPGNILQGLMRRIDRNVQTSGAGTAAEIEALP